MLYKWNSRAMADYYDGVIVVEAPNLKEAKEKVMLLGRKGSNYECGTTIEDDLKQDPEIIESGVVFIRGSA